MAAKLYIQSEGKELGPASLDEIKTLMSGGWVSPDDPARCEGETEWRPVSAVVASLQEPPTPAPPPAAPIIPPAALTPPPPPSRARLVLAGAAIILILGAIAYPLVNQFYPFRLAGRTQTRASNVPTNSGSAVKPGRGNTGTPIAETPPQTVAPEPGKSISPKAASNTTAAIEPSTSVAAPSDGPSKFTVEPRSRSAPRVRTVTSEPDSKSAPFGAYDVEIIKVVQKRWLELLNQNDIVGERSGQIVVTFRQSYTGRISDLRVEASDADGVLAYLCEKAVRETSPYPRWPQQLLRSTKSDSRQVRFTFKY